jgi:phosphoribosyl-AMP cyclohydrolase
LDSKAASRGSVDFGANLCLSCNKTACLPCARRNSRRIQTISATDTDAAERESGSAFMPKFDSQGLLTAVVTDAGNGAVLMVAFMNSEALALTRLTGFAHFWSRSRARIWMKGETSGHTLKVEDILVDCDQDALVIRAVPAGPACHTGATSCFYRKLEGDVLKTTAS